MLIAINKSTLDRFWSRVDKNGPLIIETPCWNWKLKLLKGYGRFTVDGETFAAHRYSYFIEHGNHIPDNLLGCHKCDNRACVNPDHIFVGTHKDNTQDCIAKGRGRDELKSHKGENHPKSKLTQEQVIEIREKHVPFKYPYSKLAKEYNVSTSAISMACRGDNWSY